MRMALLCAATVVVAVNGIGCSEIGGPRLRGDVTFTAEERAAIERGEEWLATQVGADPFGIVWDLPHPARPEDAPAYSVTRARPVRGVGFYDGHYRVTLNPDATTIDGLERFTAHEIGHFRGLDHHIGCGLMSDEGQRDTLPEWTPEDEHACVVARVCHR